MLTITPEQENYKERVAHTFHEPFLLEDITWESDVFMENAEFDYLTELHQGILVTPMTLSKAISYLLKKKKFETITLITTPGERGKKLHIKLVGFWTFHALKLHGVVLGKDRYRQYYLLEPGERFDERKHELSLEHLQEAFAEEGYLASKVTSRLEHDAATKSITAHITLKPKGRFSIGTVCLVLRENDSVGGQEAQELERELYKKFLHSMHGSTCSKHVINKETRAIKRYLAKKGFFHVPIELSKHIDYKAKEVDLTFTLELYRKKQFYFEGNTFFTEDELLDTILLFGQSAWLLPTTIIHQEMEQLYHKKGFWSVEIAIQESYDRYDVAIREGVRARIENVILKNVRQADPIRLVKTHFSSVLKRPELNDELIAKSVDALIASYVARGFLDAKIAKQEYVLLNQEAQLYALEITLEEGDCCYLASVELDRFKEFEHEGPFLAFKEHITPQPFTMELLDEQRRWLVEQLRAKGYATARVHPEFARQGTAVAVTWKIAHLEEPNTFGKTVMVGSSTFPFAYVVRELQYQDGQLWDQCKLKKSMLKLKDLEIFEGIHLHPYDVAQHESEQAIMLKLQADDPYEVRLRAGFAVQQLNKQLMTAGLTYRVGGAFYVKNPFNVGDQFRVEADFALSQRTLLLQYRRPWILDRPIRTIVQGYSNKFQYPGLIGSKKNLYEVVQQGFLVGLLRKYAFIDTGFNVGIELMETTMRNEDQGVSEMFARRLARAINFEPELLNVKIPYWMLEPTLLIDYVDNKLQPTKGTFTVFSVKGMFPFGPVSRNAYFVRLAAEQSFFIPLRPMVLALRLRFGHIIHRKLSNVMPNERFYLGGANSIRSYDTDRCPPLGEFVDDGGCVQLVPQGGRSMVNFNAEIRFPVYKQVSGVVFQDFGALGAGNVLKGTITGNLLAGTGFGIRYNTPIGPMRFDIAWKWNRRDPREGRYAWFLTLGNAF